MNRTERQFALDVTQTQTLREELMKLSRLIPQVDMLEECGPDCRERRDKLARLKQQMEAMNQHFGTEP